jgi:3-oxoadipate enol-lactonase
MRTLVNGIEIRYTDTGPADARAVIFLHGFPFNRTMWQAQTELLAGRCRVITFDLRGHGDSQTGEEEFSMALFARDLLGLMDALRIEKAVLCGLSMGGYIALNAVESHPERFSALILCDTQCAADTPEAKAKRLAAIRTVQDEGVETFAEALLGNILAPETLAARPKTVAAVREMILGTSPLSLERSLRAMREREETCSKLPDISVPVLLLVGETDKITPQEAAAYMKEHIGHAHLSVIEAAGHLSNLENPAAFNAELEKFISAL